MAESRTSNLLHSLITSHVSFATSFSPIRLANHIIFFFPFYLLCFAKYLSKIVMPSVANNNKHNIIKLRNSIEPKAKGETSSVEIHPNLDVYIEFKLKC